MADYLACWPDMAQQRTPLFPGANQAAEQLRRLPAYRQARTIAVGAEPVLLQVRINALMDGKNLLVATPGLKQGLVRLAPAMVPINRRFLDLQGSAMFKAGKPLRLPRARLGVADMLVGSGLAVSRQGVLLGDGRGIVDIFSAMLGSLGVLAASAPIVVLQHEKQIIEQIPPDEWDARADIILTPHAAIQLAKAARPPFMPEKLSPLLARLPVVKAFCNMAAT